MTIEKIRIMVVDDHPVVRKGIVAMIDTEDDLLVVGECKNGAEAVESAQRLHPDVILMDLIMPGMGGIEAIRLIKQQDPSARILVLTSFSTQDNVVPSLEAGALGYLLKDSDPAELIRAIHLAHRGEGVLDPAVTRQVLNILSTPRKDTPAPVEELTEREIEVLRLLARGLSNQEISQSLTLSEATVHSHVSRVLNKLKVSSRTQAALYALRQGIATLED